MLNLSFKPHRLNVKANSVEMQKLYLMLKLIPEKQVAQTRPSLALGLVVDTSGSMYDKSGQGTKTKLDQAIEAAHALIDDTRLLPNDKVTVIQFDDNAQTLLRLNPLSNKRLIHEAIDSLRKYSGGTYMGKGMQCLLKEFCDLLPQMPKRVFLLTDGETFDEDTCIETIPRFAEANITLAVLGLGIEYNQELLLNLADQSRGRHYHLTNIADLCQFFDLEIGSSIREVITDLLVSVSKVKGVTLDSFTRVYPSIAEIILSESPYHLGNISAGDFTVFILEFTLAGIARPPSRVRIAQVGLVGHAPALGRRDELPVQNLFINFVTDEAGMAIVDEEVLSYVQQKNVDRMTQNAMRLATIDPERAKQTLQAAVRMTKNFGNNGMTKMLNDALEELNSTGKVSANTIKTVRAGGKTKTIKSGGGTKLLDGGLSNEEIRRITGA